MNFFPQKLVLGIKIEKSISILGIVFGTEWLSFTPLYAKYAVTFASPSATLDLNMSMIPKKWPSWV